MVPLKTALCNESLNARFSTPRAADFRARPQLVLKDLTEEPRPVRRPHLSPLARTENALLGVAAAAALGYFLVSAAAPLAHAVQQNYASQPLPQIVTISKTIKRGDTLAGLALRYGNPSTYLLAREEQIARANNLSGTTPLLPGQRLLIPVTNPAVIARIVHPSHAPLVASR